MNKSSEPAPEPLAGFPLPFRDPDHELIMLNGAPLSTEDHDRVASILIQMFRHVNRLEEGSPLKNNLRAELRKFMQEETKS